MKTTFVTPAGWFLALCAATIMSAAYVLRSPDPMRDGVTHLSAPEIATRVMDVYNHSEKLIGAGILNQWTVEEAAREVIDGPLEDILPQLNREEFQKAVAWLEMKNGRLGLKKAKS